MDLQYRSHARVDELALGECAVRRAGDAQGKRWWNLWARVRSALDGAEFDFCVPVNPGGSFGQGPGGKTWGMSPTSERGVWLVSPSIDVKQGSPHDTFAGGEASGPSLWHEIARVVDVPDSEPWASP